MHSYPNNHRGWRFVGYERRVIRHTWLRSISFVSAIAGRIWTEWFRRWWEDEVSHSPEFPLYYLTNTDDSYIVSRQKIGTVSVRHHTITAINMRKKAIARVERREWTDSLWLLTLRWTYCCDTHRLPRGSLLKFVRVYLCDLVDLLIHKREFICVPELLLSMYSALVHDNGYRNDHESILTFYFEEENRWNIEVHWGLTWSQHKWSYTILKTLQRLSQPIALLRMTFPEVEFCDVELLKVEFLEVGEKTKFKYGRTIVVTTARIVFVTQFDGT